MFKDCGQDCILPYNDTVLIYFLTLQTSTSGRKRGLENNFFEVYLEAALATKASSATAEMFLSHPYVSVCTFLDVFNEFQLE